MPKRAKLIPSFALDAACWLLLIPIILFSVWVRAQETKPGQNIPSASTTSSESQPSQEASPKTGEGKQNENGRSSEEEELRNSPIVRSIARITGLSVDGAYWLCVLVNFGIVALAIGYALRKKLPGLFRTRSESIQKHLEEARKTSEEARRRLAEVEARLSRLDAEIEAMHHQAEENARAEDQRTLAEAEEERRRIVRAAEQEIAMAAGAARRELQAYAGELAVDLAGKKIRVGSDTDQSLVREFTSWLGKDGH